MIDAEDLRTCTARILPSMQVPWRGGRTLQLAPGMTASPTLRPILAAMAALDFGSSPAPAWYRRLAAELRAAFATRLAGDVPQDEPPGHETCTTHLTVIDTEGTMVSMTTTLMAGFGSRVVLPETGMLMNNGIMLFDPRPGLPNSIAPGQRLLTNMCPMILREGDTPILAAGASGGRHIMAATFQLMTYIADFNMDAQTAAHHPRLTVAGPDRVGADPNLGPETLAALATDSPTDIIRRGLMPGNFANPNAITTHPNGTRTGISDTHSPWSVALAQG